MKRFEEPLFEELKLNTEDVICTSPNDNLGEDPFAPAQQYKK